MVNRREFVIGGGATAGVAAVGLSGCEDMNRNTVIPKGGHVVVVGAGFAGIGASELLLEKGYRVDLIEAKDRVGGRALSQSMDGFPADLGPNWLRLTDNPLLPIAQEKGLVSGQTDFGDAIIVTNDGPQAIDAEQAEAELESQLVFPYLRYNAKKLLGLRPRAQSVGALLQDLPENPHTCLAREFLKADYAADLEDLSGDIFFGAEESAADAGYAEPTAKGGMDALARALVNRAQPSLNEHVSAISRTSTGVTVRTNKRVIEADAVIVTASIHVLKYGGITFEPGLPAHHQNALQGMEMGNFVKLWARYPAASWQYRADTTVLCNGGAFGAIIDFSKSHGAPVVMGFAAGQEGRALEHLSDTEAQAMFHETVQDAFQTRLPAPTHFAMNRWGQDPLVGGAYMYPTTQYRSDDNLRLRKPIAGRILLAGEALADNYGYVDTAWSDGRRAANMLMGG